MKKLSLQIVLFMLLINTIKMYSQNQQDINLDHVEKVDLFTDRSLYIAGETILFSAFVLPKNKQEISKVLYIELINESNNQIIGEKFILKNNKCNGSISIPADAPTGNYLIKSYTKYMRNFNAEVLNYSFIKIINSAKEYIPVTKSSTNKNTLRLLNKLNLLELEINKQKFTLRDTVKLKIKFHKNNIDSVLISCVSVVPKNTSKYQIFKSNKDVKFQDLKYFPETRGISLTGVVKNKQTNTNLSATRVNLSIIGLNNDFMAAYTNEKGQFYFSLPDIKGKRDIFLCTERIDSVHVEVLIDNDFSPNLIEISHPNFYLTNEEQKAALILNLNVELKTFFEYSKTIKEDILDIKPIPFYGIPTKVLYMDEYVQLPSVEDYFNELPFLVKVRKNQGNKYLKIQGSQAEMNIYKPLVLIDMVATNAIEELLSIPAQYISHIDIVNTPYLKGNIIYGGIVSIISQNNDYGNINLPNSGTFINYSFIANDKNETEILHNPKMPDTRNTLYWNPNLNLNPDSPTNISFTIADTPGEYEIIIRGLTNKQNTFEERLLLWVE